MAIAFFDFDRTLIAANSAALWIRREMRLGHMHPLTAVWAASWMLRYHLGFSSLEAAIERAISTLAGTRESEIRERSEEFYETFLKHLYRPGALEAVERHRREGDRLVLLTSSSLYLAELVQRDLRFDAVLCNRFEVDAAGLLAGKTVGAVCFGGRKLDYAREFAERVGMRLEDSVFYTDSITDAPVLRAVGTAVAVNPDGRLKRLARKQGWSVVDWGKPTPPMPAPAIAD